MTLMFGQRHLRGSSQDERSEVNAVRERLAAGKVRYRAVLQHAR